MPNEKKIKLTEFGREVVSLLSSFRMATPSLLERFTNRSADQIKNELRRLRNAGLAEAFNFIGKQVYYRLTREACGRIGASKHLSGPLGPQSLRIHFAVLDYCASLAPPTKLLTNQQLLRIGRAYGVKSMSLRSGSLYVDESTNRLCLAHIFVDFNSDPRHLLNRVSTFVKKRNGDGAFRLIVTNCEFLAAFVTGTEGKAEAIRLAIRNGDFSYPFRIHVSSDLMQI